MTTDMSSKIPEKLALFLKLLSRSAKLLRYFCRCQRT